MELERKQVGDLTVRVLYDEDPESPRTAWDNLGTMVCKHRRYDLGDVQGGPEEVPENVALALPLGLIDHSGLSMYVGSDAHPHDPGGWDSGQVGVIYVTHERLRKEYGNDPEALVKAEAVLRGEVDTYDRYLRGAVYGYVIEDEDGNTLESVWGYFTDSEEVLAEGVSEAEAMQDEQADRLRAKAERLEIEARKLEAKAVKVRERLAAMEGKQ